MMWMLFPGKVVDNKPEYFLDCFIFNIMLWVGVGTQRINEKHHHGI